MIKHVVVWIDAKEARLFHIGPNEVDALMVNAPPHSIHHKHPPGASEPKNHPDDAKRFFVEVEHALAGRDEILIVGPSTTKLDFFRHLHKHAHELEARIVGIETVDHPTDGQLVAYAKSYFERSDAVRVPLR